MRHGRWVNRRSTLLLLTSALALAFDRARSDAAGLVGPLAISNISIDDGSLGVRQILLAKLQQTFADRLRPGDRRLPVLVVHIQSIYLTTYVDTYDPHANVDWMEGSAALIGPGHQITGQYPLLVNLPAAYSGAWYLPDIDTRRIDSLCYAFAQWLRRAVEAAN
jgi:hypothetical protein